jgi:hypothetical protein
MRFQHHSSSSIVSHNFGRLWYWGFHVGELEIEVDLIDAGFSADVGHLASLTTVSDKEIAAFDVTDIAGIAVADCYRVHGLAVSE